MIEVGQVYLRCADQEDSKRRQITAIDRDSVHVSYFRPGSSGSPGYVTKAIQSRSDVERWVEIGFWLREWDGVMEGL